MNLKYMKVSLFEITYKKKWTFSWHSNLLRCTCIVRLQNEWLFWAQEPVLFSEIRPHCCALLLDHQKKFESRLICSGIMLGLFEMHRRSAVRTAFALFKSIKSHLLSYHSRGTLMSYPARTAQRRCISNKPIVGLRFGFWFTKKNRLRSVVHSGTGLYWLRYVILIYLKSTGSWESFVRE